MLSLISSDSGQVSLELVWGGYATEREEHHQEDVYPEKGCFINSDARYMCWTVYVLSIGTYARTRGRPLWRPLGHGQKLHIIDRQVLHCEPYP